MREPYEIIKSLLRTEKSTALQSENKYLFLVAKDSAKIEIRKAVEALYKVKVAKVNTFIRHGKRRRVRQQWGRTPDEKKALVTLKEGHKIEVA